MFFNTVLLLVFCSLNHGLLIPAPNGPYSVAANMSIELVDSSRIDPFDPKNGTRRIMASLFYPVSKEECEESCKVPYMSPISASFFDPFLVSMGIPTNATPNFYESLELELCCKPSTKAASEASSFPLVLFAPGLEGGRLQNSAFVQTLASAGYAVVAIDFTFETTVVEYPDGTYTLGRNLSTWLPLDDKMPGLLDVHVADAKFLLDQFGNASVVEQAIPGTTEAFNATHVGFYGHSLGGATALLTVMRDERIAGALNFDGGIWGTLNYTNKPAILFGRAEAWSHNLTDDKSWQATWPYLKGWRRELGLHDTQHTTFCDLSLLISLKKWPITDDIKHVIGTLDGKRAFDVETKFVEAFMNFAMKGDRSNLDNLVNGSSKAYPEVVVGQG